MEGRFHYYEGYDMKAVTFPERVMYELGIETLFVSNASGGMNPEFQIGDLMIIDDHINFFPEHPLRGKNFPTGPRFPDMHEAYDKKLRDLADDIAKELCVPRYLFAGSPFGILLSLCWTPFSSYSRPVFVQSFP